MKNNESQALHADYLERGSESAFQELVTRYLDLVYSTALRRVGGDTHLAQDVAQAVFLQLARKAHKLRPTVMLGGWLHRTTCNVAMTVIRGERRRQLREREAAQMNALQNDTEAHLAKLAPVLDEAIEQLGAEDRAAILLRFFEQQGFSAVGETLGISEDGARKRVGRALDKLQSLLKRRGVALSAVALGTVLSSEAVTTAPAGLAASIAGTALASAAAGGSTSLTLLKIMSMTKLKLGVISAVVVAAVATPWVFQRQALDKLGAENRSLRRLVERVGALEAENGRLSNLVAANSQPRANDSLPELLRLRGEVTRLQAAAQEVEQMRKSNTNNERQQVVQDALKWKAREAKLKELVQQMPQRTIPEFYLLGERDLSDIARDADLDTEDGIRAAFFQLRHRAMNMFAPVLQPALKSYTEAHNGQPPEDVRQLAPYFDPPIDNAVLQRYIVLYTDSNHIMGGWTGGWVVTQREPVDGIDSRWGISPVGFSAGQFDTAATPH